MAGVISAKKHLWVFGGYNMSDCDISDTIERVDISTGGIFEQITVKNQSLLQQSSFTQFAHQNQIMIIGDTSSKMISFNIDTEEFEETEFDIKFNDDYYYLHNGY